jgi:hypothetical protein
MATLTYGPVTLDLLRFDNIERMSVYSEDSGDWLYEEWTIKVTGLWHATWLGTQGTSPVTNDVAVRQALLTPHRQLTISFDSNRAGPGGAGPEVMLASPVPPLPVDAKNGPEPVACVILQNIGQGETFVIHYVIKTYVRDCPEDPQDPRVSALISNRWQMSYDYDSENYTTSRTVVGQAVFDTATLGGLAAIAGRPVYGDEFRRALFFPIPARFQRDEVRVEASPDGTTVNYRVVDRERIINHNPNGSASPKVEFQYTQRAYQEFDAIGAAERSINLISFAAGGGGSIIPFAGAAAAAVAAAAWSAVHMINEFSPKFEERATVRVWGNALSGKTRLMQHAMAILFSRIVNRGAVPAGGIFGVPMWALAPPPSGLELVYDMKNNVVEASGWLSYGAMQPIGLGAGLRSMTAGTPDTVFGGTFRSFATPVIGAIIPPGPEPDFGVMVLAGSPLLTTNPTPPGDGFCVASYLTALVTQILKAAPCNVPGHPVDLPEPSVDLSLPRGGI